MNLTHTSVPRQRHHTSGGSADVCSAGTELGDAQVTAVGDACERQVPDPDQVRVTVREGGRGPETLRPPHAEVKGLSQLPH
jgi:hypothetical protein